MRILRTLALWFALLALSGCAQLSPDGTPALAMSSTAVETTLVSEFTPAPILGTIPTPTMVSLPSPEPQLTYAFDPYALSSDAKAYLGARLSQYKLLVDAVLKRQAQITLGKDSTVAAISCLYGEFVLSVLLRDFTFSEDMSTLTLTYTFDAAEHSACITAFKARTREVLLTTVWPGYNECERALVLYRWTAQNITYLDGEDVSPYHALMDGVGICQSYEGVYRYLLLQLGIDVLSGSAMTTDNAAHAWSIVKLDGVWYHMDPTFECSITQGAGLRYFGMADYDRMVSGMVMPFKTGVDDWNNAAAPCEDSRFASLYRCTRWELERDAHRVLLYEPDNPEPYAMLDTTTQTIVDVP